MCDNIYFFDEYSSPKIADVGGKALSLIIGRQKGLPVPDGFVLSVDFFSDWFNEIKRNPIFDKIKTVDSSCIEARDACDSIKKFARTLLFTENQTALLNNALGSIENEYLFAVRSSSPEEDLDEISFAGMYETALCVKKENLEVAINRAFSSCFDYRVFSYKIQNGFKIDNPKIAVIVQKQVLSEISGVAFSINPLSNSFNEVVVNANWGLGETVVSGIATPDEYIVDKISIETKKITVGSKEKVLIIDKGSTIVEHKSYRSLERTLSESALKKVTKLVCTVEKIYQKYVDIEWAFSKGKLWLLQVRAITNYFPVSPVMRTELGEHKVLYMDLTISTQGLYKPISMLGSSIYYRILELIAKKFIKKSSKVDFNKSPFLVDNGKIYLNLSVLFAMFGKEKIAGMISVIDPISAEIIKDIDVVEYALDIDKGAYRKNFHRIIFRATFLVGLAFLFPERINRRNQRKVKKFKAFCKGIEANEMDLGNFVDELLLGMITVNSKYSAPTAMGARIMLYNLDLWKYGVSKDDITKLGLALPNNVTVEMGFAMYDLAHVMPKNSTTSEIIELINKGNSENPFIKEWISFMDNYGHRCPEEFDIGTPRYRDNPESLIKILESLAVGSESPRCKYDKQKIERTEVFKKIYSLIKTKNYFIAKLFAKKYKYIETFAGHRETPKNILILVIDAIRKRVIAESEKLCAKKGLDSKNKVFGLSLNSLKRSVTLDNVFNLNEVIEQENYFIDRLKRVKDFPVIFDSRGMIFRRKVNHINDGGIFGIPISPGKYQGKVKVLNSPSEKTFIKGEILVARATDPGWTPLFLNASAIVLEVGGMLQHGALIAREYGIPCVAGIKDATTIFRDGDLVKVDGSSGFIKIII